MGCREAGCDVVLLSRCTQEILTKAATERKAREEIRTKQRAAVAIQASEAKEHPSSSQLGHTWHERLALTPKAITPYSQRVWRGRRAAWSACSAALADWTAEFASLQSGAEVRFSAAAADCSTALVLRRPPTRSRPRRLPCLPPRASLSSTRRPSPPASSARFSSFRSAANQQRPQPPPQPPPAAPPAPSPLSHRLTRPSFARRPRPSCCRPAWRPSAPLASPERSLSFSATGAAATAGGATSPCPCPPWVHPQTRPPSGCFRCDVYYGLWGMDQLLYRRGAVHTSSLPDELFSPQVKRLVRLALSAVAELSADPSCAALVAVSVRVVNQATDAASWACCQGKPQACADAGERGTEYSPGSHADFTAIGGGGVSERA